MFTSMFWIIVMFRGSANNQHASNVQITILGYSLDAIQVC